MYDVEVPADDGEVKRREPVAVRRVNVVDDPRARVRLLRPAAQRRGGVHRSARGGVVKRGPRQGAAARGGVGAEVQERADDRRGSRADGPPARPRQRRQSPRRGVAFLLPGNRHRAVDHLSGIQPLPRGFFLLVVRVLFLVVQFLTPRHLLPRRGRPLPLVPSRLLRLVHGDGDERLHRGANLRVRSLNRRARQRRRRRHVQTQRRLLQRPRRRLRRRVPRGFDAKRHPRLHRRVEQNRVGGSRVRFHRHPVAVGGGEFRVSVPRADGVVDELEGVEREVRELGLANRRGRRRRFISPPVGSRVNPRALVRDGGDGGSLVRADVVEQHGEFFKLERGPRRRAFARGGRLVQRVAALHDAEHAVAVPGG